MIKKVNNNNNMELNSIYIDNWKNRSKKYLLELECFLDKVESIQDEELRKEIIIQMLKCDKELTCLAEKIFEEQYKSGIENGKKIKRKYND